MKYGLPFAIITKSFWKEKYGKRRECWKPVLSFPAMFFKGFFSIVIKTQDYSQLIKNGL